MTLYLIPGLGADGRLFAPLLSHLPATVRPQVLEWLPPLTPQETLPAYAARLAAPIPKQERCWVAGVSFGGIVALEVGRLRPQARIIQISSISASNLLPWQFRLVRTTHLYQLAPPQLLRWLPGLAKWFFGIREADMYALLRSFLKNMDDAYTRWALQSVLTWESAGGGAATRIHGTHDRVFPLAQRQVEYRVPGGPHFMVYTHAAAVGAILSQILTTNPDAS